MGVGTRRHVDPNASLSPALIIIMTLLRQFWSVAAQKRVAFLTPPCPAPSRGNNAPSNCCQSQSRRRLLAPAFNTATTTMSFSSSNEKETTTWVNDFWLGGDGDVSNVLVCGDGDLSFSAFIAQKMADAGVQLTATVLEDEETHKKVYEKSVQNCHKLRSWEGQHEVQFGVDATRLKDTFRSTTFSRVRFNFPHWRGKTNHKRNRDLLSAFLKSAREVLSPGGQIHIALCEGQGGATASTPQEWRRTWMASQFAAEHGLLLRTVQPYQPSYNLSSHRGVDRAFHIGQVPKLYVFHEPNGVSLERQYQLCCSHELHICVPRGSTAEEYIQGDAIERILSSVVDNGIRVEVPARRVVEIPSTCEEAPQLIVVYFVVYCGERVPLTRSQADGYRAAVETEVAKHVPLRADRAGRLVSRPFPYPVLQPRDLRWFSPDGKPRK